MNFKIDRCSVFSDSRGDLIQFLTASNIRDFGVPFGQVYLITFSHKGVVRGNHYHETSSEVFCLLIGSVEMILKDIHTGEKHTLQLTAQNNFYERIFIAPNIAHAIHSVSDYALMISFSSEEYDPNKEDKINHQLY